MTPRAPPAHPPPFASMTALLDALLDESVDEEAPLLILALSCCSPSSLLALTRCSERLRQAAEMPLLRAEQRSAAMVYRHLGVVTLDNLATSDTLAWQAGLPFAQCRHLGAWLRPGEPLEGVRTLRRLPLIVNHQVAEIDLAPLRSGASLWSLVESRVGDELLTVLAMPIAVNASMTVLWLSANGISATGAAAIADAIAVNASLKALFLDRNKIGDAGAAAIANAIAVNASLTRLDLGRNEIGDTGAVAISSAIALNDSLTALMCVGFTTNLHPPASLPTCSLF